MSLALSLFLSLSHQVVHRMRMPRAALSTFSSPPPLGYSHSRKLETRIVNQSAVGRLTCYSNYRRKCVHYKNNVGHTHKIPSKMKISLVLILTKTIVHILLYARIHVHACYMYMYVYMYMHVYCTLQVSCPVERVTRLWLLSA